MRKGFRVLITDRCNLNCPRCFNRQLRNNKEMLFGDFVALCDYLHDEGGISRLKIMGGEPTTHSEFEQFVSHAQRVFESVHVFTNAVNDRITNLALREHDTIIYNLSCMDEHFSAEKLMPGKNFVHAYETRIDAESDVDRIKRVLARVHATVGSEMVVNLTLDCTEQIFKYRKAIIDKWNAVATYLSDELGIGYRIDHGIPHCFFAGSNMMVTAKKSVCLLDCAGLVTPELTLRHCNQTTAELLRLRENNRFVSWDKVEESLIKAHREKIKVSFDKGCSACKIYGSQCDGGCFAFKDSVSNVDLVPQVC